MTLPAGKPRAPLQPLTDQPTSRWWDYVASRRLVCPAGHHFKNNWHPLESGLIQCSKWIADEKRECGLWIFAFVVRGGKCVIAEVTQAETSRLAELTTPAEVIDYLGIFEQISARDTAAIARPAPGSPRDDQHRRGR